MDGCLGNDHGHTNHLILHTILNYQINDKGSLFKDINFKTAYDCLVIIRNTESDVLSDDHNLDLVKSYLNRLNIFFKDFSSVSPQEKDWFFMLKLKNKRFRKVWIKLLNIWSYLVELIKRLNLFLINPKYRSTIWNDRKRITNLILTKLYLKSSGSK